MSSWIPMEELKALVHHCVVATAGLLTLLLMALLLKAIAWCLPGKDLSYFEQLDVWTAGAVLSIFAIAVIVTIITISFWSQVANWRTRRRAANVTQRPIEASIITEGPAEAGEIQEPAEAGETQQAS
jgi:hypothetical protein